MCLSKKKTALMILPKFHLSAKQISAFKWPSAARYKRNRHTDKSETKTGNLSKSTVSSSEDLRVSGRCLFFLITEVPCKYRLLLLLLWMYACNVVYLFLPLSFLFLFCFVCLFGFFVLVFFYTTAYINFAFVCMPGERIHVHMHKNWIFFLSIKK